MTKQEFWRAMAESIYSCKYCPAKPDKKNAVKDMQNHYKNSMSDWSVKAMTLVFRQNIFQLANDWRYVTVITHGQGGECR